MITWEVFIKNRYTGNTCIPEQVVILFVMQYKAADWIYPPPYVNLTFYCIFRDYMNIFSIRSSTNPTAHAMVVEMDQTRICSLVSVIPLNLLTTQ